MDLINRMTCGMIRYKKGSFTILEGYYKDTSRCREIVETTIAGTLYGTAGSLATFAYEKFVQIARYYLVQMLSIEESPDYFLKDKYWVVVGIPCGVGSVILMCCAKSEKFREKSISFFSWYGKKAIEFVNCCYGLNKWYHRD